MKIFLMIVGGVFALGAIAEKNVIKSACMTVGFIVCVIGLVALQIL